MIGISVIMPLYNVSQYLGEALHSVLNQTFKEFELICINDASDDNTMEILYSFAQNDSRIKILINETRMGAAYSRNRGIKEAMGEFIVFLDGDDIFDEDLLKLSYQEMKRTDADIVMYEVQQVSTEQIHKKRFIERSNSFLEKYCKNTFTPRQCEPLEFLTFDAATSSKFYKKSFICSNHIEFQTLSCCNDKYFGYMALMLADRVIMLSDRRAMVYARVHFEETRISYDRDPMCGYLVVEKLGEELEKRGLFEQLFQHYYCVVYHQLVKALTATKTKEKAADFYHFLQNKGIRNLTLIYEVKNLKLNKYISLIKKFDNLDFESGWYKNDTNMYRYLEVYGHKVIKLIEDYHNRGLKIALWGAGKNGRVLLDYFEDHNVAINMVVDKDASKQGNRISGYTITPPQEIISDIQVIIAVSYKIYCDILEELKEKNIEIVNIGCVLEMNL